MQEPDHWSIDKYLYAAATEPVTEPVKE